MLELFIVFFWFLCFMVLLIAHASGREMNFALSVAWSTFYSVIIYYTLVWLGIGDKLNKLFPVVSLKCQVLL